MIDRVSWEWLCSLYKPIPKETVDPEMKSCNCGYHFYISKFQKVRMLLFGDIIITCPKCSSKMTFRLIHHSVKIKTEEDKKRNEVYRNA